MSDFENEKKFIIQYNRYKKFKKSNTLHYNEKLKSTTYNQQKHKK